ncbi:retropepsin-like aspartic protease [Spirosoma sp. KUDC1026]|uniref:retropepsin-like aspartic protease n=1 Tax=Spirosoma sp. KUDC1026 TaxID=2745947 RepID=UPI00159BCA19|nr:retropepsin-like aspartic protease [Spirosoma sp. KUDC1026]QKZ14921.1 clan AA aspartic protease [Spirosoma sp. KUDC1026]
MTELTLYVLFIFLTNAVPLKTILSVCLLLLPFRGLSKSVGDTLTTTYLIAVNHWLFGRDSLAKQQLLNMPAQTTSIEQVSAWGLLLDEFYYWPGHYQRYLQLADSLHITTRFYSSAKLLAQQLPVQYQLKTDSLELPIHLGPKSHPVIEVQINGRICRLVLDTGAQSTLLSRRFAKQLGAKKLTEMTLSNYDGKNVPGSLLLLDSLILGGLTIKNLPAVAAGLSFPGIDGLLGWDVLRQFAITIDYANQRFSLRRSSHKPNSNANLLGGSLPMLLTRSLSGNQLNIMLDTGAGNELSISPTGLTKIGNYDTKLNLSLSASVGQFIRVSRKQFIKRIDIHIDGVNHSFKKSAIFRTDEVIGQVIRDGLIGSRAFRKGILMLDAPSHWFHYQSSLQRKR